MVISTLSTHLPHVSQDLDYDLPILLDLCKVPAEVDPLPGPSGRLHPGRIRKDFADSLMADVERVHMEKTQN